MEAKIGYRCVICGLVVSVFTWIVSASVAIETLDIHSGWETVQFERVKVMDERAEEWHLQVLRHSNPHMLTLGIMYLCFSIHNSPHMLASTNSATSWHNAFRTLMSPPSSHTLWADSTKLAEPRPRHLRKGHVVQRHSHRRKVSPQIEFTARTCTWQGAASTLCSPDSDSDNGLWSLVAFLCWGNAVQQSAGNALEQKCCPCKKKLERQGKARSQF